MGILAGLLGADKLNAAVTIEDLGGDQFRVMFTYAPPSGTRTVNLAGTFNDWNTSATAMRGPDEQGRFRAELVLARGRYEYKFVRDGSDWEPDPDNPENLPPYGNAILRLGIEKDEPSAASNPTNMARRAEHPEDLIGWLNQQLQIVTIDKSDDSSWDRPGQFPWMRAETVSFFFDEPGAENPYVSIAGRGFRTGYVMDRWRADVPLYVLTLRRSDVPAGAAYTIEFEKDGKTQRMVDLLAHTITSRNGKPVAVIAAPDTSRGRIVLVSPVSASGPAIAARELYVYLPPGYDPKRSDGYPVIYMQDGQNLWDDPSEPFGHGGWQVNTTADRLITAGKARPFIVVGIPNSHERIKEYAPGRSIFDDSDHAYLQFLLRDVKPRIDERFRTSRRPQDTAIMGSSLGAIIALQAALLHPRVFGAAGCMSPAFSFKDADGKGFADLIEQVGHAPVRLYVDHGTAGTQQDGAVATRAMVELLRKSGWREGADLDYFVHEGAEHNERAWRFRLERPLAFLFRADANP